MHLDSSLTFRSGTQGGHGLVQSDPWPSRCLDRPPWIDATTIASKHLPPRFKHVCFMYANTPCLTTRKLPPILPSTRPCRFNVGHAHLNAPPVAGLLSGSTIEAALKWGCRSSGYRGRTRWIEANGETGEALKSKVNFRVLSFEELRLRSLICLPTFF
jgi:hypothetical protein